MDKTTPFITTKIGRIDQFSVYFYEYSEEIKKNKVQLEKFTNWLRKSDEIKLFDLSEKGFKTFMELRTYMSWQYRLVSSIEITPPYQNIQRISAFISFLLRNNLSGLYERFLNNNIFVTDKIDLSPFCLNKCIEFNVEVFKNGKVLVHFLPITKITNLKIIDTNSLQILKSKFVKPVEDIEINLIDPKKCNKVKINIFNSEDIEKATKFMEKYDKVIATFNYHFLSSYSHEIFTTAVKETVKDIDKSIYYLQEKLSVIEFNKILNFQQKPFARILIKKLGNKNNLKIGSNISTNKQSAAYYNGMFEPASNSIIQPILVNDYPSVPQYSDLIEKFNKGSINFHLKDPIKINSKDPNRFDQILKIRNENKKERFLIAVFTLHELVIDFAKPLKKMKLSFQIYLGKIDIYKLSNFTVKCLEKVGGLLSVIKDTWESEDTYFVGIDLGHSAQNDLKYSNLALAFFNNEGRYIFSRINKGLPRNEAISEDMIKPCFQGFFKYLKGKKLKMPNRLVIHRDGKLHPDDERNIINQAKEQLNVDNVEIVEIIKHGYPVFACFENGAYINLQSGDSYMDEENRYALLITNIQSDEKNAIVNPIIIKHRCGNTKFETVVDQVYWFSRIYTNNLYNSTRLPATTLKANNIVTTSRINHQATYVG